MRRTPSTVNRQILTLTKGGRREQAIQGKRMRWPSRLNESRSALISRAPFGYPDRFFRDFPQLYGKCQGIVCKVGARPVLPSPCAAASPKRLEKVAYPQLATEPVWAQNPDSQQSKVYLSHN